MEHAKSTAAVGDLREFIDWSPFFHTWELRGRYPAIFDDPTLGKQARELFNDAQTLLDEIATEEFADCARRLWILAGQLHRRRCRIVRRRLETIEDWRRLISCGSKCKSRPANSIIAWPITSRRNFSTLNSQLSTF